MNCLLHRLAARFRMDPLGVAMPGPRLGQRIRQITDSAPSARISLARATCLVTTCAALCAGFFTVALSHAQPRQADWEKSAGGKMSFEVASVKVNMPDGASMNFRKSNFPLNNQDGYYANGGLLTATDYPVNELIGFAYKLTPIEIQSVLSQMPKWATAAGFDVQARAAGNPTKDQMRLMMQSLLAERFKLAVHRESRRGSVDAFVLAKAGELGPTLKRHSDDAPCVGLLAPAAPGAAPRLPPDLANGLPGACGVLATKIGPRGYLVTARNVSLGQFAGYLPGAPMDPLDRPVEDQTGLSGTFDIALQWEPDTPIKLNGNPLPVAESAETFPEALKDQLGLKLEPTTGMVNVLVIDHIEEPSPN